LALNLTNDPKSARIDQLGPELLPGAIRVAGLGSLAGILSQAVIAQSPSSPEVYYYINDHLGTPQMITDSHGEVVWKAEFEPFGKAGVDYASTLENNFRFPGQYYDAETRLHYNYRRYYDPKTGRYLTPDPLNLGNGQIARQNIQSTFTGAMLYQYGLTTPQVLNLYLYVTNNPINSIDVLGLINLAEAYAKFEGAVKPYLVGGALIVTGAATTAAGVITIGIAFPTIPVTGPAGVLVTAIGAAVTVTGAAQFGLGLDVYADELRRQLGLPDWFDIYRNFELFQHEEEECK
jgi:RHS repeat-associated protein